MIRCDKKKNICKRVPNFTQNLIAPFATNTVSWCWSFSFCATAINHYNTMSLVFMSLLIDLQTNYSDLIQQTGHSKAQISAEIIGSERSGSSQQAIIVLLGISQILLTHKFSHRFSQKSDRVTSTPLWLNSPILPTQDIATPLLQSSQLLGSQESPTNLSQECPQHLLIHSDRPMRSPTDCYHFQHLHHFIHAPKSGDP